MHSVIGQVQSSGEQVPQLELPSAHLYGKDGDKDKKQLYITAKVALPITLGSMIATVPVFILPDNKQACLLGMNAIPLLGVQIHHHDGHQILPLKPNWTPSPEPAMSSVNLIVGHKVRAQITTPDLNGEYSTPWPDHIGVCGYSERW